MFLGVLLVGIAERDGSSSHDAGSSNGVVRSGRDKECRSGVGVQVLLVEPRGSTCPLFSCAG